MSLMKILTIPDDELRKTSEPVKIVDTKVQNLMQDMLDTMYAAPGIGLAAPQVGVLKRVIVVDLSIRNGEGAERTPYCMANPEITWASEEQDEDEEGCLSIPGSYGKVIRPTAIKVTYVDENNQAQMLEASGLLARCIQHEIDHLNGVLYIDYLSKLKRDMIERKHAKRKAREEKGNL